TRAGTATADAITAANGTDKKIDTKLEKPFYPISFRTDRPRFPPARE
ncbi:pilS cassette, partial [Neisseria meningitidis]